MIVAINYADENFIKSQKYNTKTAYKKGKVDKVIEYSPSDIDLEFRESNKKILSYKRGAGLWLWKPYFILKTLNKIEYGDYLFYCDSGAYYTNKVQYLVDIMELNNEDIMVYELPLISKQWTKGETFKFLDCNEEIYKNSNQILATYFLIKKTKRSIKFIEEFLDFCCDEKNISYEIFEKTIQNDKSFIAHREDQSIFSIICRKYNIVPFREPSQFGDRPWEYMQKGYIYMPKVYMNSNYPQIVASYRKDKILKFKVKEFAKKFLLYLNIYNEKKIIKKRML
ncbi:hypothetical protein CHL78_009510 [Romboutsia weinsteinii]|uniref:Glycosyl transferase n=1 Tax=Romboutsia weinsteinii TaxID=2020949 RepID=A0A371J3S7_9FIRM|nr:hypothetical protein [Romboutsia weinsteinii]RDY27441.1 hypothetical protein CHL78_009510 [Romboutsia weinsteinii]